MVAAGNYNGSSHNNVGSNGNYWSSSLDMDHPSYAKGFRFHSIDAGLGGDFRTYGRPVRAVLED